MGMVYGLGVMELICILILPFIGCIILDKTDFTS